MLLDMSGRRILVTGGSRGIGRAIVSSFSRQGGEVHYTHRGTAPDSILPRANSEGGGSVTGHVLDMQDVGRLRAWFTAFTDTHGTVDVLVNNVGGPIRRSSFETSDLSLWQQSFELNVLTVVATTQGMLLALRAAAEAHGEACIVNISSISASHGGGGDSTHYAAAKGAVSTLTKGLSQELAEYRIRVNAVVPSAVDTDFQREHSSPERIQSIIESTPLRRIGKAEDVAGLALFLSDPQLCGYVTGALVSLDGGRG